MASHALGTDEPATVTVRGLSKSFNGAVALKAVDLELRPREVHGLLGHNGSGKSTLIKILAGYHVPDAGDVHILGVSMAKRGPADPARRAISFVHQDLGLIPSLSVLDNLLVGDLAHRRGRIRWRAERRKAEKLLAQFGVDIPVGAQVQSLSPLDRARLAIVRAFAGDATFGQPRVVVLDEPTVFLPQGAVTELFALVRTVAEQGASVLFVSHQLEEVKELTDRVTVLREGAVVATVQTAATTEDQLVELIVGRTLIRSVPEHKAGNTHGSASVEVRGLTGGMCRNASWRAPIGSIVGLAGVVGSGADEVPALLFGVGAASGTLVIDGEQVDLVDLDEIRASSIGIAYVPADRIGSGSYADLSVRDNLLSQQLPGFFRAGVLRLREMSKSAADVLHEFGVRPPDPNLDYSALSGGNQQKVMLARWLTSTPRLLLLHEPTQGVDIGARQDIFRLITQAGQSGVTTFVASADFAQLAEICDVVLVFSKGSVRTVLRGADISTDHILQQVAQSGSASTVELHPEVVSA